VQLHGAERREVNGLEHQVEHFATFIFPQEIIMGDLGENDQTIILLNADELAIDPHVTGPAIDIKDFNLIVIAVVRKFPSWWIN
jgi:hypothetical protein